MIDLKKFKEESKKYKMSEASVYLLQLFTGMFTKVQRQLNMCMAHHTIACKTVTTKGGSNVEEFIDANIKPKMHCTVSLNVEGATPVTIKTAKCEMGKLVVTFSADPGTDHKLTYQVNI